MPNPEDRCAREGCGHRRIDHSGGCIATGFDSSACSCPAFIEPSPPPQRVCPTIEEVKAIQRERGLSEHVVWIGPAEFVIAHTDEERAALDDLSACPLHRWLHERDDAPASPGYYEVWPDEPDLDSESLGWQPWTFHPLNPTPLPHGVEPGEVEWLGGEEPESMRLGHGYAQCSKCGIGDDLRRTSCLRCDSQMQPFPAPVELQGQEERWEVLRIDSRHKLSDDTYEFKAIVRGPMLQRETQLVPAANLAKAEAERDEWETCAKEVAVQGAGRAAWTGEAKGGLERIADLTASDEIRAIVATLLDWDEIEADQGDEEC